MAEKDFVVKNGLVVNSAVTINSTAIYYNGSQLVNSTSFEGTANNVAFVGTVSAANVVSNAQLTANLANYQTSAGLAANVLTLTANNTSFVGTVTAANVVSNAQLTANLANYQTTAGLSANVATLTANNSTRLNSQLASFYTNAENISTGTLPSARISGNYTGITNVGTLGTLTVSGNVALNNFSIDASSNVISIPTANVNIDSGLLFVDATNNRVGISNTTPDTELTVTGSANVSQDVRIGRDLYVTRNFIVSGNLTTTGTSVANGDFNPASNGYSLGNTTSLWNLLGIDATLTKNLSSNAVTVGTINATSNGAILTRTSFTIGNSSTNSTINSTSFTGTANNTSFVGSIAAANVVSNAQLSGNLAGYVTTTNLTNNLANYVTTTNLTNNLANYVTATNLTNNLAALNATNLTTGTVPNARLNTANTTAAGIVQLVDSIVNTSITIAAAANSVKLAYDTAILANTRAASAQSAAVSAYSNAVTISSNADNLTSGTVVAARLPTGNATTIGGLQIVDSVANVSATVAAAANSVKLAYDTAILANTRAASAQTAAAAAYTNAVAFASNATNISSGTLAAARLPTGNATTIGGLQIVDSVTNTSATIAASANSVKIAYNAALNAFSNATTFASNATNITSGTLASARISGAYTGITQVGTLAGVTVTGNSNFDSGVLFVDGTNNRVGVNTTSPSITLQIAANDAILLPLGNTSQRPTGSNGMFRFNTDTSTFEGFANGSWGTIAGSGAGGYYKGNLGAQGNTNNKANLYRINSNTQSNNITISAGENALTVGPMVIDTGYNLTIEEGGRAVII
jgi:hypothetical protein